MPVQRPTSMSRPKSSFSSLNPILETVNELSLDGRADHSTYEATSRELHRRSAGACVLGKIRRDMSTASLMSLEDLFEIEVDGSAGENRTLYKRRSLILVDAIMAGSADNSRRSSIIGVDLQQGNLEPILNHEKPHDAHSVLTTSTKRSSKSIPYRVVSLLSRPFLRCLPLAKVHKAGKAHHS